jgi:HAMP domain-containing protein/cell division septum initiation protein DivIVA
MRVRLSITFKILLPYLVIAIIFFLVFLGAYRKEHALELWLSLAGITVSLSLGLIHLFWLIKALGRISRLAAQLSRGSIPEFTASRAKDGIGDLERNLETYVSNLRNLAAFSRAMAAGDFTGKYEKLGREDELGDALNQLKIGLMKSREEGEARRQEEEIRTWTAQGLARFSTLFREVEDNLQELSTLVMKELVAYTEADVGALFITLEKEDEEEPYLELTGSYAFDREKQIHRSFKFGEGLVGRAALEKELIYVTELPSDYLKIRSGLGEDRPSSILLVPVVLDQQVLGVMELASLGEMSSHQIEFVRQLADALASTLAKVKANLQNRRLFDQTKKQAEALSSQEKVFKQKMEQLEEALEGAQRKEAKLLEEIEALRKGGS